MDTAEVNASPHLSVPCTLLPLLCPHLRISVVFVVVCIEERRCMERFLNQNQDHQEFESTWRHRRSNIQDAHWNPYILVTFMWRHVCTRVYSLTKGMRTYSSPACWNPLCGAVAVNMFPRLFTCIACEHGFLTRNRMTSIQRHIPTQHHMTRGRAKTRLNVVRRDYHIEGSHDDAHWMAYILRRFYITYWGTHISCSPHVENRQGCVWAFDTPTCVL